MRVLVVLLLAAIIVYLVRGFFRRLDKTEAPASPRSLQSSEPMRQCAHCGIYFPASEAVGEEPDQLFCSEEHRRRHLSP